MSFGFSSGDIALFTKFITKVVSALKDEGGSKSEYQFAIRQCQGVLELMNEVQQLDFSNVSQSLKSKIEELSENTTSIVVDFKNVISRYDKSMGKDSKRGAFTSAPRKAQWAFDAAEDLNKLQPRLSAQLHLIQIVLHMGVWKFLNIYWRPERSLATHRRSLILGNSRRSSIRHRSLLNRGLPDRIEIQDFATQLTDLVYQRLLRQPSMSAPSNKSVYTLPRSNRPSSPAQLESESSTHSPSRLGLHSVPSQSQLVMLQESSEISTLNYDTRSRPRTSDSLAEGINEHLRSLNLEELSYAEFRSLDEHSLPSFPMDDLVQGSGDDHTEQEMADHSQRQEEPLRTHSKSRRRLNMKFQMPSFELADPIFTLSLAASIFQVAQYAATLSMQSTSVYKTIRKRSREFETFSRRIMQYSQLLLVLAETIERLMPAGNLQRLTVEMMSDTQRALTEADRIMKRYYNKPGGSRILTVARMLASGPDEKSIRAILEEIESLKSNLSIMLQTFQVQAQGVMEKNTAGMR